MLYVEQIPNAGVSEVGTFQSLQFKDGKPVKPTMATLEVNLIGVMYSTRISTIPPSSPAEQQYP
jgi:hypothetical protein